MEVNGVRYYADDFMRICEKADHFGMDSLTEDEQVVLDRFPREDYPWDDEL